MSVMQNGMHNFVLESFDDLVGNSGAILKLKNFADDVEKGLKRTPLLIFGPSGVGKSSAARLLAQERGWNIVELNASDYRDKESIDRSLLSAASSRSIFGKRNLILLDEVDEMASYFDKGSSSAISNLLSVAKNPVMFIANDMWDQRISFLRGKVEAVEFKRLKADETMRVLETFCRRLNVNAIKENIEIIAARSNGDARSAINDVSVAVGYENDITEVIGMRDRKVDIFNLLDKIFFANTLAAPLRVIGNTDLDNDMLIKWLDENIPNRYIDSGDLAHAFDILSEASSYSTKAMRAQYYTYWRYMKVLMSSGIALAKKNYPSSSKRYAFPKIIRELSASKSSRRQKVKLAEKLQTRLHSSIRRILYNEMNVIELMIKKALKAGSEKSEISDYLIRNYGLDERDAAAFLA